LHITGELVWRVPWLSTPDPDNLPPVEQISQYEAVRLFVERARFKRVDFTLTPENALAVARVCHQLGGLPLAIEMAAARVSVLSVQQIAARLSDSLLLLTTGNSTADLRHRTLEATVEWSYNLLCEAEQRLLRTLSVFAGSFNIEAAVALCGAAPDEKNDGDAQTRAEYMVLDLLTRLVDKSLLNIEERSGETRYRLLETIRQYAFAKARQCGEVQALRERHLRWYTYLTEQAKAHYHKADEAMWYDRIEAEHDNLRAALSWSLTEGANPNAGLQLATNLYWFWFVRGYMSEGRRWLELALEKAEGAPPDRRAEALYGAGLLARTHGDYEQATKLYAQALELYRALGDKEHTAAVLNNLGILSINQGDYEQATRLLKESMQLAQELGNQQRVAMALSNLANIATDQSDYRLARDYLEQCRSIAQQAGNKRMLAVLLNNLGYVARCLGNYAEARSLVEESLAIKRVLADPVEIASSLHKLAEIESCNLHYEKAVRLCEEGLAMLQGLGHTEATAMLLNTLAEVLYYQGEHNRARARFEEALATSKEKWIIADSLYGLARVAQREGDYNRSAAFLREALKAYMEIGSKRGIAECLVGTAKIAARYGLIQQSAVLFGAAEALFEATGYRLHPAEQDDLKRSQIEVGAHVGKAAWAQALADGRAMQVKDGGELAMQVLQDVLQTAKAPHTKLSIRTSKYPNDLTRREVEVLSLVAEGLTDAEIAERLFLSPHTVHAHLYSIYNKLNVKSRAAATRFALSHNLVK
jgi:non-specific serine/threonine protein kinase